MQPYRRGSKYNGRGGVGALTLMGVSGTELQKVQAQVRSMAQSYNGSESYAMRIASMSWKAY